MAVGDKFVALGAVARPHGVRGELRIHRFNPESTLLLEVDSVLISGGPDGEELFPVESSRLGPKGVVLMTFERVQTREEAEAMRGREIGVPRSLLPDPEEGEWYHVDLIGLSVVEAGEVIGRVDRIASYPSVECLVVKRKGSPPLEIPIRAPWLASVDLKAGQVEVTSSAAFEEDS